MTNKRKKEENGSSVLAQGHARFILQSIDRLIDCKIIKLQIKKTFGNKLIESQVAVTKDVLLLFLMDKKLVG